MRGSPAGRPAVTKGWHPAGVLTAGEPELRAWKLDAVTGYRLLGVAGAILVAGTGWAAGALPVENAGSWRDHALSAVLFGYCGITMLVAAWIWAGRTRDRATPRSLLVTLVLWSAPLVAGPPLFSRDVYAYLAQGAMAVAGLDVYSSGVGSLGGILGAQVPAMWQDTPTPYGPVFVVLAAGIAALVGSKLIAGLIGMRLLALAGVVLMTACLPTVARRCGVDPAAALWLGALNPLVPLHLVAGAHNEAVMLGLLIAGIALALRGRFAFAAVLVTLSALVKAPAVAGLAVVAALWWQHLPGRTRHVHAVVRTTVIGAVTCVAVTGATGLGYGWIASLSTPISPQSWSVTSALGRASRLVLDADGPAVMRFWAWCGLAATLAVAAWSWWRRDRFGPVTAAGLSLGALALLGPATRPWYALWGLVLIAAAAPAGRVRRWSAATCGVLAFAVLPSGFGPDGPQALYAVAGVALACTGLILLRRLAS
ncbi:polyprenol phosphomannose-dependent alpha 1,6 mannosyltransferase MptB [Hamadaea flava]|uniref:Polyprenol phosphomannose-dependent alpha 1,6 mannosyltransferase MptB n=1 Tax=Hamadaea flava TaxID=1742688 RepID=A0ABV8LNL5_9ACTN|nr:polyprenol phosphomannose-dependent alpha 1,6 mannosyltransferase MptB [Hamadaea flava]